jgi:hypothetical protein
MAQRDQRVRSGGSGSAERNPPSDEALQNALAGQAKGVVDVVLAIATARGVSWQDALPEFARAFDRASGDLLDRIAARSGSRRG